MLLPGACKTQVMQRRDGTLMREHVTACGVEEASPCISLLNMMQPDESALKITSSSSMSLQQMPVPGGWSHDT
jgi:hypothetical protein